MLAQVVEQYGIPVHSDNIRHNVNITDDVALLTLQFVSSLMVAGAGMKLMVWICSWHSWLDRK
jgi:hypothetical protein